MSNGASGYCSVVLGRRIYHFVGVGLHVLGLGVYVILNRVVEEV